MKKLVFAIVTTALCLPMLADAQISTRNLLLETSSGSQIVTLQGPSTGTPYQYVFPSTTSVSGLVGAISYISSTSGSQATASWILPAINGQILQLVAGVPTWVTLPTLPSGTGTNTTLIWNGTNWVENTAVTMTPTGNITTAGNLTVNGTSVTLPAGSVDNSELANSSVTINTGTGLTGGGTVALGGTLNLVNSGVTSLTGGTGVGLSGSTGAVTISNTGVTSITGTANQVIATGSTGAVTLSLPQNIHSGATPTFAGVTLTGLGNDNTLGNIVVVDGSGVAKTRSLASLPTGFSGVTTNSTLVGNGLLTALGVNLNNVNSWSAAQTFSTANINGGAINGTTIGGTTPSTGRFTTLAATGLTQDNTLTRVLVQNGTTGAFFWRDASSLSGSAGWGLTGNAGTNPATNYLGTTDAQDLVLRTNGTERARMLSSGPLQLTSTSGATGEIRLVEPTTGGATEYSSFKAQAQANNIKYLLPDTAGAQGDVLLVKSHNTTTNEVTLIWSQPNTGGGIGSILFSRKLADETRSTKTNPLPADSNLQLALKANTTYEITGTLYAEQIGNADLDIAFSVPGGTGTGSSNSTLLVAWSGFADKSGNSNTGNGIRNASGIGATNQTGSALSAIGFSNALEIIQFRGIVITGSTAGDLKLLWTPSSNSGVKVLKNSIMSAQVIQ